MVEHVAGPVSFLPVGRRGGLGVRCRVGGLTACCVCSRASRVLSATASSLRGRVTVLVFVSGRVFPHRLRVAA